VSYRTKNLLRFGVPVVIAIALYFSAYTVDLSTANDFTSLFLLMTLAMAWNLVGGFGGQFSLGHSIFVGVGSYATAVILTTLGWPLIPTILIAAAMSALIGLLLAYPLLRLRGPYLAVGSLGMAVASYGWMINWNFTKASQAYAVPVAGQIALQETYQYAIILLLVAIVSIIALVRSPLGLRLVALRDNEEGAASIGVKRVRTLLPVWALSGLLTGAMGAVYALQSGSLTVDATFNIQFSLDAAIICVIGGLGTLSGPVIGAIIVYYLRKYSADFSNYALLIEAVILVVVVRFFPAGLVGLAIKGYRAVTKARAGAATK
jgi:branched-chain amino acid transport system permease protein